MIGGGVLVGPIEAQLRRLEPAQGRLKSQEVRVGNSWVRVGKPIRRAKKSSPSDDPHLLELQGWGSHNVTLIRDHSQRLRRPVVPDAD